VRELLLTHYRNDFDGLDGNEDCGQMSAWFVMSALGLYAVDPVSATYVMSAPLFERVAIPLDGSRALVVETERASPEDKYIHAIRVNGQQYDKLWITHAELMEGAHIVFTLGPEPSTQFGIEERAMPPSLTA
jgi:putative alpha-1,2-mannosidase